MSLKKQAEQWSPKTGHTLIDGIVPPYMKQRFFVSVFKLKELNLITDFLLKRDRVVKVL